ncbi:MAG: SRPBCC family protein [bacterium]
MSGKATAVVSLLTDTQIQVTREFDAPRHLVYRAWTTPELIRRWWTANRGEATVIEVDLRVGGRWRYVMTANGGFEVAFHGEYRELVPDERIVSTEIYEEMPEAEAITTITFAEQDGRTTVTLLVDHDSPRARDFHLQSGMESGLQDALDLLERVAQSLAGQPA